MKINRLTEKPYYRENRLNANRFRSSEWRECDNLNIREVRLEAAESPINRELSLNSQRMRKQISRRALVADLNLAALNYNKEIDYMYFIWI